MSRARGIGTLDIRTDSPTETVTFLKDFSHRRLNPLTGDWILVSPHRANRPWRGQVEPGESEFALEYDPSCYLCPSNERANGDHNPSYVGTYAFDNDFPSLLLDAPTTKLDEHGVLVAHGEPGACRVLCFTPRHDRTLARMRIDEIAAVVTAWKEEYLALGSLPEIASVQIFENRGEMMGASNLHPHGQIWSTASVPNELRKETASLGSWAKRDSCLLCEYKDVEESARERIIDANPSFFTVVPFWAMWPFETLILPRRHMTGIDAMTDKESTQLAEAISDLTIRYDNLFETRFPYSMGVHQRPTDGLAHEEWHFHLHFYPPLLRSASVRKFMVGFELLEEPQRDITPEAAAKRIRDVGSLHFLDRPVARG